MHLISVILPMELMGLRSEDLSTKSHHYVPYFGDLSITDLDTLMDQMITLEGTSTSHKKLRYGSFRQNRVLDIDL